jgi:malate dehydrogenase (oxaloacetate-decarboxylating)(NADP+)
MHDDQHGTAIICSAGVINALEIAGKKLEDSVIVMNGAGAAAIACANLIISLGARRSNIIMLDSKGALRSDRTDLNKYKAAFATSRDVTTLADAMVGADIFLGLSKANCVTKEMLCSMAKDRIVFAMANPDPEIAYDEAMSACDDIIMATGRSDYPNQVNNVLGFPFIFRGALDVRATCINEEMKKAAVYALAGLAKEPVPETVSKAYNVSNLSFGRDYIIPKPLDLRLITTVAPAVAKAAMDSGVALKPIQDWEQYRRELSKRLGLDNQLLHSIVLKAKENPKKVVYAEGNNIKVLRAASEVLREGIALPILLGDVEEIEALIAENHLDLQKVPIYDPRCHGCEETRQLFSELIWNKRQRKGITLEKAHDLTFNRDYYGVMMVETGMADAMISGVTSHYGGVISPALKLIGPKPELKHISSMSIIMSKKGPLFFADTTVNLDPDIDTLIETTLLTAAEVRKFGVEPVIAMVSYSNFGSVKSSERTKILTKVRQVVSILHKIYPELIVDGEVQMDFALNREMRSKSFPFTRLEGRDVNTFIFPNLTSGNIAYKIMAELGGAEVVGPILMGMQKPIHVVPTDCSVREIVNMTTIAVLDAQVDSKVVYQEQIKKEGLTV